MYGIIRELRKKMGWSQAQMAKELEIDQAQVSRLEGGASGKRFADLCTRLRVVAHRYPREWMELLANFDGGEDFAEYEDLFFVTERLVPEFNELWVISERPAECDLVSVRSQLVGRLKSNPNLKITYWAPESSLSHFKLLARNFALEGVPREALTQRIHVICAPPLFTFLPLALLDPRADNTIGVLSHRLPMGSGYRVVVLPQPTTQHISGAMQPIMADLEDNNGLFTDQDNYPTFQWRMFEIASLRHSSAGPSLPTAAPTTSSRRARGRVNE